MQIPMAIKYLKKTREYVVDEVFCSPSCMFSKLMDTYYGLFPPERISHTLDAGPTSLQACRRST